MPSVRLIDNANLAPLDVAGFRRAWNDSQRIIEARWPAGVGGMIQPLTLEEAAERLRTRNHRTWVYDESDAGGARVAGFLHVIVQHPDLDPGDDPELLVNVLVAGVRHEAGEAIADTRLRFRRSLLRCLARMANDLLTVEQNRGISVRVNYTLPAVDAAGGYLTAMRTFVEEMATRNGQAPTERGGFLSGVVTPAQIIAGITGLVA